MKTDMDLQRDVLDELRWDPQVDERKIGVMVADGSITLSGYAESYAHKLAAKRAAARVKGVLAIVDKIDVHLEDVHRMTDEGLAKRIAHVLTWNISAPQDIKAEVQDGVVTLCGEIDWQYQRDNILQNIEHVRGVVGVVDNIKLKITTPSVNDVRDRIASALQRHADVEAGKIDVFVSGGTVTLSGTVDSLAEMHRIQRTAWAAPGVTKLIDNLRVA